MEDLNKNINESKSEYIGLDKLKHLDLDDNFDKEVIEKIKATREGKKINLLTYPLAVFLGLFISYTFFTIVTNLKYENFIDYNTLEVYESVDYHIGKKDSVDIIKIHRIKVDN